VPGDNGLGFDDNQRGPPIGQTPESHAQAQPPRRSNTVSTGLDSNSSRPFQDLVGQATDRVGLFEYWDWVGISIRRDNWKP